MRTLIVGLMALALGWIGGAVLPAIIAGERAQGADVRCLKISGHPICKGQTVAELPWDWARKLGGIVSVSCNFERPGKSLESGNLLDVPSIVAGCKTGRYAVSLSDGAVLTNFWVDSGHIAQIDRYGANPIDL